MYMCPSSSLSTSPTYLRCSVEFAKLLVLRSHDVCWMDEAGRRGRFDSMTESYTLFQMNSSSSLLRTAPRRYDASNGKVVKVSRELKHYVRCHDRR